MIAGDCGVWFLYFISSVIYNSYLHGRSCLITLKIICTACFNIGALFSVMLCLAVKNVQAERNYGLEFMFLWLDNLTLLAWVFHFWETKATLENVSKVNRIIGVYMLARVNKLQNSAAVTCVPQYSFLPKIYFSEFWYA